MPYPLTAFNLKAGSLLGPCSVNYVRRDLYAKFAIRICFELGAQIKSCKEGHNAVQIHAKCA